MKISVTYEATGSEELEQVQKAIQLLNSVLQECGIAIWEDKLVTRSDILLESQQPSPLQNKPNSSTTNQRQEIDIETISLRQALQSVFPDRSREVVLAKANQTEEKEFAQQASEVLHDLFAEHLGKTTIANLKPKFLAKPQNLLKIAQELITFVNPLLCLQQEMPQHHSELKRCLVKAFVISNIAKPAANAHSQIQALSSILPEKWHGWLQAAVVFTQVVSSRECISFLQTRANLFFDNCKKVDQEAAEPKTFENLDLGMMTEVVVLHYFMCHCLVVKQRSLDSENAATVKKNVEKLEQAVSQAQNAKDLELLQSMQEWTVQLLQKQA